MTHGQQAGIRGGDTVRVQRTFATPKAKAVFAELSPGGDIRDVLPTMHDRLTLMADGSNFYIHEVGPWRVVCCVAHGKTLEQAEFAVVNVQRRERRGDRN